MPIGEQIQSGFHMPQATTSAVRDRFGELRAPGWIYPTRRLVNREEVVHFTVGAGRHRHRGRPCDGRRRGEQGLRGYDVGKAVSPINVKGRSRAALSKVSRPD